MGTGVGAVVGPLVNFMSRFWGEKCEWKAFRKGDLKDISTMSFTGDNALDKMLIITNKEQSFGANILLWNEIFEEISKYEEGNFYILPSSVHERATCFAA